MTGLAWLDLIPLLVAMLLALLLTVPAFATITSSALTGRVMVGDLAARGATVTATLRATQTVRTATTNARGIYWLGAMTPGEYDVTFSRAGLSSLTRPATIELGRVARADARLEPSEDEESVTSTATTVSVANTTAITTHFTADELERIPFRRDVTTASALTPVLPNSETIVDDTAMFHPLLLGEETLDEVTIVRGAQPIELDRFGGSVILARTRSGRDELFASLRDTYSTTDHGGHVLESTAGGRIVPERLWFFAAGWGGEATDVRLRKLRGLALKLTAQVSASHHIVATHNDADARSTTFDLGTTATSLRYTGVFDQRLTAEAVASRSNGDSEDVHLHDDVIAAKVSYRLADHVISAGGSHGTQWTTREVETFFVSDRWASGRWTIDAGLRGSDERSMTRVALAFDLRSAQGSHAIVASWGEYLEAPQAAGAETAHQPMLRVASIGYTSSLESSGSARIDLFHQEGARKMDQLQVDARYRLFDRFEAGASYIYSRDQTSLSLIPVPEHLASIHVGLQLPIAGHELATTALERYDSRTWTTDVGVRYDIPFHRIVLTLAGDATNVFDATNRLGPALEPLSSPRTLRFWMRARL